MAKRISQTTLNASTLDILNVIRQNASYEYQQNVPRITKATDIPRVGEIIYGTPAFSNQFINSLLNRIALVVVQSATFNNPYSRLKKGYLQFGETVEEIFVNIAKAICYTPEKGAEREFKRTLPDVRSAFHTMNWRVMYPITIQDDDLKLAFLNEGGVVDLVAKIVEQVYTGYEYDEFLLFKYMLIKSISHGKMKPISVGDGTDLKDSAVQFRGISNKLQFMSKEYNESGVLTTTPKDRQVIFMDSIFNARYDVNVLASAFNMEKAEFMGSLFLIDDFTSFDNERFNIIREESDGLEEVTADELALMNDIHAVLLDENWFQVYDNLNKMTEDYVSAGLYWNYFYHTWKTISNSPFSNAVVFVTSNATITLPNSFKVSIASKDMSDDAITLTFKVDEATAVYPQNVSFEQTGDMVTDGIAMQKYGAVIIPIAKAEEEITVVANMGTATYTASTTITSASDVGDEITLTKNV